MRKVNVIYCQKKKERLDEIMEKLLILYYFHSTNLPWFTNKIRSAPYLYTGLVFTFLFSTNSILQGACQANETDRMLDYWSMPDLSDGCEVPATVCRMLLYHPVSGMFFFPIPQCSSLTLQCCSCVGREDLRSFVDFSAS